MANYTYKVTSKASNAASWIDKLQRINPVSLASSHHTEIHFTQPKAAEVQAVLRPHVTFISAAGTTHWYLKNSGGKYTVEKGSSVVEAQVNEEEIAKKVISDAVELNWILAAQPTKVVDDDGFQTAESSRGRRKRMQTGWQ
jgi:hypothetical protein